MGSSPGSRESGDPGPPGGPGSIGPRLARLSSLISEASARAGRAPGEVTLVAASKTVTAERLREAVAAGVRCFGENRVQEAAGKIAELGAEAGARGVEWHLIGHLQSNKARRAVELFDAVHSVDSLKLAERLDQVAGELGRRLPVLIEVNLGGEGSKSGVAPAEVLTLCERVGALAHLELNGLMAVPPYTEPAEGSRPFFRRLRELRDRARASGAAGESFRELSMGMSHDFEIAVEEGATFVRIGTALFGPRQ